MEPDAVDVVDACGMKCLTSSYIDQIQAHFSEYQGLYTLCSTGAVGHPTSHLLCLQSHLGADLGTAVYYQFYDGQYNPGIDDWIRGGIELIFGARDAVQIVKGITKIEFVAPRLDEITMADVKTLLSRLPTGRQGWVKVLRTPEEIQALFETIAASGQRGLRSSYPGETVMLSDGTLIGLRTKSSSGGLTIDIMDQSGNIVSRVHIDPNAKY